MADFLVVNFVAELFDNQFVYYYHNVNHSSAMFRRLGFTQLSTDSRQHNGEGEKSLFVIASD